MALKSIRAKIYVYTGTEGTYTDNDLAYEINKDRISSQDDIILEIANLVRDYLNQTFNNDYPSHAVWVTVIVNYTNESTGLEYAAGSPKTFNYLALDGFGYFEEAANPALSDNALVTSDYIYIPEGESAKIPVFAGGTGKVTVNTTDTQITDSGNTNQKIQYITVAANSNTFKVYDTDDTSLLKTIKVVEVCEPKFTPYKVTFVNKFGAFQDLFFFKRTKETFEVKDEQHKRNILTTTNATYNTNDPQTERYNVTAGTSLQLNTGFVHENYNSAIEEMFLSENVWIRWDNKTLAVIPKTKSMSKKTSLNDRLINYTVDFEFAFNKINNVR